MSLRDKLNKAAAAAALEATANERGRCLWCLQTIEDELQAGVRGKLMTEAERNLAEIKLNIAQAIFQKARRHITAGTRPEKKDDNGRAERIVNPGG